MAEIANKEEKKKDPGTRESPEEKGQEERERITRRKKMMEKRIRKARLMRGMLCLGLVALCVCTGVLAVSLMGKGGQGKNTAAKDGGARPGLMPGEGDVRPVRPVSEIVPKETAEVRRPRLDIPKIDALYGIHVQEKGWSHYFADHLYGMAPAGRYITGIRATLHNQPSDMTGTIQYQVNVSGKGWQDWSSDGQEAGDVAGGTHLEAVCMRLTGDLADYYDVLYSVLQNNIWTDWVKNGEEAGVSGMGQRVDGVRISVVRKQLEGTAYAGEIDPSKPMVALTYDDGPSQNATPRILAKLAECGGRATFFMVGNRAEKHGHLIRQMVEQGCEVANHTYDHTLMTKVPPAELESQLVRTNQVVFDASGVTPVVMRPCGGATNDAGMVVAGTISMPAILWSIDTLDWRTKNAESTISAVLDHVRDGDIILMHDLYTATADASDVVIPELVNRGYQLVTVSELSSYRGGLLPGRSYSQFRP
ncbi:MAG: polysaccharide deacetylase family protein [Lachnospiraceae bacterium]|nr:polysaccharide deacetylase family protein [Lachnospiraceae bacterium]